MTTAVAVAHDGCGSGSRSGGEGDEGTVLTFGGGGWGAVRGGAEEGRRRERKGEGLVTRTHNEGGRRQHNTQHTHTVVLPGAGTESAILRVDELVAGAMRRSNLEFKTSMDLRIMSLSATSASVFRSASFTRISAATASISPPFAFSLSIMRARCLSVVLVGGGDMGRRGGGRVV